MTFGYIHLRRTLSNLAHKDKYNPVDSTKMAPGRITTQTNVSVPVIH